MLIGALLLPVTLAATTIVLGLMGMSFNMMTLGGMAAAVGLVVAARSQWALRGVEA